MTITLVCGIVLSATIASIIQEKKLSILAMAGMGLIVTGVIVMNVFSQTAAHYSVRIG